MANSSRDKNGRLQKGHKGLKPKGAISKKTRFWKDLEAYMIADGVEKYLEYLEQLDPATYVKEFRGILEFVKPKLARTENKQDGPIQLQVIPILGGITNVHTDNSNPEAPSA